MSSKCLPRRLLSLLLYLSLCSLPSLSWQKGSCVWLPDDNREEGEGEEVFKEEQVINDFFLYNSRIFLEVPSPLSCPENNGGELFSESWVGGVGTLTKICSHSRKQQKALLIKGAKRIRIPRRIVLCAVSPRTQIHLFQLGLQVLWGIRGYCGSTYVCACV